jgi:hypothetical protein
MASKTTQLIRTNTLDNNDLIYIAKADSFAITKRDFEKTLSLNGTSNTRIIAGAVVWASGLTYETIGLIYEINGSQFHIADGIQVTLSAADPTNPRIDVIYGDDSGAIAVEEGIASATPVKPTIQESYQIELTFATISAAATEPDGVSIDTLYLEDAGQPNEWDATDNTGGVRIDTASTTNPITGTKSIRTIAALVDGDSFTLTNATPVNTAEFSYLRLSIRLLNVLAEKEFITVALKSSSATVGTFIIDKNVICITDLTTQTITIFNADFGSFSGASFDNIEFITRVLGTTQFQIDDITIFTSDVITSPSAGLPEAPIDGLLYGRKDADWEAIFLSGTGLEAIDEGNGIGWRLKGRDPNNYGDIGLGAVDLSYNPVSSGKGALGIRSFASNASVIASGNSSFASNTNTTSSGDSSRSGGVATESFSFAEFVHGTYSTDYTPLSTIAINALDRLINFGNGTSGNKHDAFTILKNGKTGIGFDNFETTGSASLLQVNGDVDATTFTGDGSNLTNVDAETFDTLNSTQFLRSDTADIKTIGDLSFDDNVGTSFGTGTWRMRFSSTASSNILYLSNNDFLIQDNGILNRFIFGRTTGNLTLTGSLISQGTVNNSFVGNVGIGIATPTYKLDVTGDARFTQPVKIGVFTVGTLPTGTAGDRAFVTDSNASTFNAIVASGGSTNVPVFSDGTNWRIG